MPQSGHLGPFGTRRLRVQAFVPVEGESATCDVLGDSSAFHTHVEGTMPSSFGEWQSPSLTLEIHS